MKEPITLDQAIENYKATLTEFARLTRLQQVVAQDKDKAHKALELARGEMRAMERDLVEGHERALI